MENSAKLLIATLAGTLLLIIGVSVFFSGSSAPQEQAPVEQSILLEGATHAKGASESVATVTLVEFSDFQCPACEATAPVLDEIIKAYPQVRMVYRHFPLLSIHRNAVAAGTAAEAAFHQGKFWEMHDSLFAAQAEWSELSNPDEVFFRLARELSLDEAAFKTAYESSETRDKVMSDLRLGEKLRVGSTPTLYYNGELVDVSEAAMRLSQDFPATTQELFDAANASGSSAAQGVNPATTQ